MAWTYLSESANQLSCAVKGFLALGPVRSGGLDAWQPGLGAEMARLFRKGNPGEKHFTWRCKNPFLQRRLDYVFYFRLFTRFG